MTHHAFRCVAAGDSYEAGPTVCAASPAVIASIQQEIKRARVLSAQDARLASMAGLVGIPHVGRVGFNDGVIYPPVAEDGPHLSAESNRAPSLQVALPKPSGTLNCLVLLVDFEDNKGAAAPDHFRDLLFNPDNPNSMHSFYRDLSHGKLLVSGKVTDWIRADEPYQYYVDGESGTGGNFPRNTPGLLHEIITRYCASDGIADFDQNGDGYIDGLFLVHAGGGAEAERDLAQRRQKIWSHKWTLPRAVNCSGVKAYAYFTAPEDGKLGVFSHEFGHFLGLPDLYDTSYRSLGIGQWCLMSGGSWNGGGDQPARMSAWCLHTLGWIKPKNVTAAQSLTLDTLENDKNACYRLWRGGKASSEYFLIENRQRAGRDAALPGDGLALWHVDESQSDNTNPLAYRVALVQADGRRDLEFNRNSGDPADLFPGPDGVVAVDDHTGSPHTRTNVGVTSGVALSNISQSGGIVALDVTV